MARRHSKQHDRSETAAGRKAARITGAASEQVRSIGDQMGDGVGAAASRMAQGAEGFSVLGEKAFAAWMRSSNTALQRVLEMNVELATWSHEQLGDGVDAIRSLSQCRTLGDAYGVQLGLMRSSMEKSMRHASNVLNLASHVMIDGTRMVEQGSEPAARD